ncbi:MAG: DNA ligase D [Syntrophomonas sp.]|nr:DNA ligase D [Syntrophomonas sp.]
MTTKLDKYNQKRDFAVTGEPEGRTEDSQNFLRFAVQHHIARRDHFDLRLEWDGVLLSWAVPKGPSYNTRDKRLAIQVENHPLEYRNFEGLIPKGEYGGGVVMLWDEGYWEPQQDVNASLSNGSLKFVLNGRRLRGKWALIRMKASAESMHNWLLLKEKDDYTQNTDGISEFTTSIRTGRTMVEIETGAAEKISLNPFDKVVVQLAKLVNEPPGGDDWLYEVKYDGYRILAYIEKNNVQLITRNGHDSTKKFLEIANTLIVWAAGRSMVLDGEMVIADAQGKTNFQALQNYMKSPQDKNLTYIVFDILALDGADLRGQRLIDRKEILADFLKDSPKTLHYSQHIRGNAKECFLAACKADLEGIVGKKADSIYSGTRNGDWIKLKCIKRQEFVIGGYTLSDKKTSGVSSLLLGVYAGKELIYAGRAGTGLTISRGKELEEIFAPIMKKESPFQQLPPSRKNEKVTWLEPELVAEIAFAEWTEDHLLRHASFKGLRTDKNPRDIKKEMADEENNSDYKNYEDQPAAREDLEVAMATSGDSIMINGIKITNPNKVIFEEPEITKADVVRYYAQVSQRMLPYLDHRILSLVRCPKGIFQSCFYKKHPGPDNKGVIIIPILNSNGEKEDYFYVENTAGLIFEAQMGTLEFHTWGSRIENLEKPDIMVFDLDPDENLELDKVRQGVKDLKSVLEQLALISYLKTSGGKGYHVVLPFQPSVDWDTFHDFAKRIAEVMEQQWPDRYTSNVRKSQRTNKIFIDWIRNGRGATSVAPYSIRAKKGAPVSMPITWKELDTVSPGGINMTDAISRISANDPWKDFFTINQQLK